MMTYMGIIEQRINEILQCYAYIQQAKNYDNDDIDGFNLGVGPTIAPSQGVFEIKVPDFNSERGGNDQRNADQ